MRPSTSTFALFTLSLGVPLLAVPPAGVTVGLASPWRFEIRRVPQSLAVCPRTGTALRLSATRKRH